MILTALGKEFIILNEEIVIYVSFLIVLTILIQNFGKQMAAQFKDQSTAIANSYSQGSQDKVNYLLKSLSANSKTIYFVKSLISFELTNLYKLIKFQESIQSAIIISEYKLK